MKVTCRYCAECGRLSVKTQFLAVAVPPDWTPSDAGIVVPRQIEPGTVWEQSYKQRVALLANQIFVAAYNAGFETAADYSAWVAYQVQCVCAGDCGAGHDN